MSIRERLSRPLRPRSLRSARPSWDFLEDRIALSASPLPANYVIQHSPIVLLPGSTGGSTGGFNPFNGGSPTPYGLTPAQVRTGYGINQVTFGNIVGDGTGQTIAIVDAYDDPDFVNSTSPNFATSDLAIFDRTFGLPDPPSFTKYNQTGGTTGLPGTDPTGPGYINWETEESLDIEWAHALAPMANIDLVEANSADINLFNAVVTAAGLPGVSAVSMSWGGGEFTGEQSLDSTFVTPAGHQGVTYLASTGDSGSPGVYPAYSPNVVAVGGTTLYLNSDNTYNSEIGWLGSGGGISTQEAEPSLQSAVQGTGKRTIPDVSLNADPGTGVAIIDSYNNADGLGPWLAIGGTSFSSPAWAALIAIANQGRVAAGGTTLDGPSQTLPALYKLPANDFHDILSGSNGGFSAGAGYDEVTGLGTPKANLLIPDLVTGNATPSTLVVSSFAATSTGFTASFDKAINLAPLNLYDTATAGFGPADVTVVGASTGPVAGSLVVNPGNQAITFVKTGGVLAPDTYTVTFRSAANGFTDTSGNLLDGNGDGTPGDNYTTTFLVAPSSARVIGVPDFARGPGQPVDVPATGSGLPLTLSDGTGVTQISMTLTYNASLLTITGAFLGASVPSGSSGTIDLSTPGRIVLNITSPTAFPAGLDTFATLTASVPTAAPYASKEALVISNIALNGGAIPATDGDGVHVVAYLGDTTGNGGYSSFDATLIRRVIANVDTGFAAFPLLDPTILGDIAGHGSLSSLDATYITQYVANIPQPRIPALPGVTIVAGGPDPLIWLPQDLTAAPGSTLSLPILFRQTNGSAIGLDSANLAIEFDPAVFEVSGIRLGDLTGGFTLAESYDDATGEIIASLRSPSGAIELAPGARGTLLYIDLMVRPGASLGSARVNLLGEGRVGGQVVSTSLNDGGLTLSPAPTDSDLDPVDGSVMVGPAATPAPVASAPVLVPGSPVAASLAASAVDRAIESSFGQGTAVAPAGPTPADPVVGVLIPWAGGEPSPSDDPVGVTAAKKAGAGRVLLGLAAPDGGVVRR